MTASEKLRALDEAMADAAIGFAMGVDDGTPSEWPPNIGQLTRLRNALPAIIAQTEAAEAVLHEYHLWSEDANDGEFAIWSRDEFMAAFSRLQLAMNALNEELAK